MAARFQKATGLKSGPASAPLAGDPLSWAYYDMGRWAFGSRVWWIPDTPATDTTASRQPAPKKERQGRRRQEVGNGGRLVLKAESNAYRWISANDRRRLRRPGPGIEHPDFPGQDVEIGGFAPFVGINPPAAHARLALPRPAWRS